jgi:hypothetical protein
MSSQFFILTLLYLAKKIISYLNEITYSVKGIYIKIHILKKRWSSCDNILIEYFMSWEFTRGLHIIYIILLFGWFWCTCTSFFYLFFFFLLLERISLFWRPSFFFFILFFFPTSRENKFVLTYKLFFSLLERIIFCALCIYMYVYIVVDVYQYLHTVFSKKSP